jgi:hypothetical protein
MLGRVLVSGTLAAAAVTAVASLASRRATGSHASALNATSHVLWGQSAARRNAVSLKYTGVGLAANYGASLFWAVFYELFGRGRRRSTGRALRDGALVSAAAYIVDYHVVPKRLTPGFELRLPGRALAGIYAALALGLALRDAISGSQPSGVHTSSRGLPSASTPRNRVTNAAMSISTAANA